MPRDERLLERLRRLENNPGSRLEEENHQRRLDSIRSYLERLLNTRAGNADIDTELGLPDLTDLPNQMSGDRIREVQESIRKLLMKYESRLGGLRIEFVKEDDEPGQMRFRIMGQLAEGRDPQPAVFTTLIEGGGKITISS